jgi:hypothetical protein
MIKLAKRFKPSESTLMSLCAMVLIGGGVGLSHTLAIYFHLPN